LSFHAFDQPVPESGERDHSAVMIGIGIDVEPVCGRAGIDDR